MSKNAELMSTAPSCFVHDTCPPSVSMPGRGAVPLRGRGGSGHDGVRSGHSRGGGRATRRAGQAGRPGQTAPLVEGLRARALEKMPRGCRFGRAASNRKASAVRAGEEGGVADAHSDRPEGFSR